MDKTTTEKDYPIQKRWILKSAVLGFLVSALVSLALSAQIISVALKISDKSLGSLLGFGIYIGIFLLTMVSSIITMILRRLTFHYSLEKEYITINQGIISKSQIHIRYGVIQNILIGQDIFDRLFRVVDLRVQNAIQGGGIQAGYYGRQPAEGIGVSGNTVEIPGLDPSDAQKLKDEILQKVKTASSDIHSGL